MCSFGVFGFYVLFEFFCKNPFTFVNICDIILGDFRVKPKNYLSLLKNLYTEEKTNGRKKENFDGW